MLSLQLNCGWVCKSILNKHHIVWAFTIMHAHVHLQEIKLHISGILESTEWISSGFNFILPHKKREDMFNRGSARTSSLSNTIILDIQRAPISFKVTSEALHICLISAKGHYMSISSGLSKNITRRLRIDIYSTHTYQYIHTEITSYNRFVQTICLIGSHLSSSRRHNLPASAWHNRYQHAVSRFIFH